MSTVLLDQDGVTATVISLGLDRGRGLEIQDAEVSDEYAHGVRIPWPLAVELAQRILGHMGAGPVLLRITPDDLADRVAAAVSASMLESIGALMVGALIQLAPGLAPAQRGELRQLVAHWLPAFRPGSVAHVELTKLLQQLEPGPAGAGTDGH